MQYKNDDVILIDRDFSHIYRAGRDLDAVYKDILGQMEKAIAAYKDEQDIYNNVILDSKVIELNKNIGV